MTDNKDKVTKEPITIRVIVKEVKTDKVNFMKYKMVNESGKLVDLRFKKGNDTTSIDMCSKCNVTLESLSDASSNYEFPRFYADGILAVEKIC